MAATRSSAGVGITLPKVAGALKPTSSVMIRSTFGAPFGGTIRGCHQGPDCAALRFAVPPQGRSGAGSASPGMVRVPPGEPIALPVGAAAALPAGAATGCAFAPRVIPNPLKALRSATLAVEKNNSRRFILLLQTRKYVLQRKAWWYEFGALDRSFPVKRQGLRARSRCGGSWRD